MSHPYVIAHIDIGKLLHGANHSIC